MVTVMLALSVILLPNASHKRTFNNNATMILSVLMTVSVTRVDVHSFIVSQMESRQIMRVLTSLNEEACLTGYIDPFFGYCSDGPVSEVKARPCNNDGDCLLLDTTGRLVGYSVCSCGFNAGSFAYCNLAQGDKEYLDMISAF